MVSTGNALPEASQSHCSPCKTLLGIVPWVGVCADAITVAASATSAGTGNLNAIYVAIGGGGVSAVAHIVGGLAVRKLWPKKSFEQNAARVEEAAESTTTNIAALQATIQQMKESKAAAEQELERTRGEIAQLREGNLKELAGVQQAKEALQRQLDAEQSLKKENSAALQELQRVSDELRKDLDETKTEGAQLQESSQKRIEELTKRLTSVEVALEGTKQLTKRWEEAVATLSQALSSKDTEPIRQLLENLQQSEQTLMGEAHQVEDQAGATSTMLSTVKSVASQLQETLSKLAGDNLQERELLSQADTEKKGLTEAFEELRAERKRLEQATEKYKAAKTEAEQAVQRLQKIKDEVLASRR